MRDNSCIDLTAVLSIVDQMYIIALENVKTLNSSILLTVIR